MNSLSVGCTANAWYQAFNVQPGDKLYIKPADRVSIW